MFSKSSSKSQSSQQQPVYHRSPTNHNRGAEFEPTIVMNDNDMYEPTIPLDNQHEYY